MTDLLYVTANDFKFRQARVTCQEFGITLEQSEVHIQEIQSEDAKQIGRDKAQKIYEKLQRPVVVSDDSWSILGLKGFPGPYMKYINDWFTPEDWVRLTQDLKDRTIILRQIVVYQDADEQVLFSVDINGVLLKEARGESNYPNTTIVSFDGGKLSSAEYHARGESIAATHHNPWHEFAQWYNTKLNP